MTKESYIITETITRYEFNILDLEEMIREKYSLPADTSFNWDSFEHQPQFEDTGPLYVTSRQKEV
jgi:hypothetical protein